MSRCARRTLFPLRGHRADARHGRRDHGRGHRGRGRDRPASPRRTPPGMSPRSPS